MGIKTIDKVRKYEFNVNVYMEPNAIILSVTITIDTKMFTLLKTNYIKAIIKASFIGII